MTFLGPILKAPVTTNPAFWKTRLPGFRLRPCRTNPQNGLTSSS